MASNNSSNSAKMMNDVELDENLASYTSDMDTGISPKSLAEAKKFPCAHCSKICLSQRGLTRHNNVRHSENTATTTSIATTVNRIEDVLPLQKFRQILKLSFEKIHEDSMKWYPNLEFKSVNL